MDATLQVIIATLSGFIVAFLADPVKSFFQNNARRSRLRNALYGEIASNYACLENSPSLTPSKEFAHQVTTALAEGFATGLRTECYRGALSQETLLFYELPEAPYINLIYSHVDSITKWAVLPHDKQIKQAISHVVDDYLWLVQAATASNTLDKNLMNTILKRLGISLPHKDGA